jgi:hypothetical protein
MDNWQPIATAPKEEMVLLCFYDGEMRVAEQRYEPGDWEHGTEGFWFWNLYDDAQPTHWMPLPTPPSGEAK